MPVDTLSTLPVEAKQFYERNMLYRAQQAQVLYNAGRKTSLPANSGNSVSWRRMNALALNTNPLIEAITPNSANISITEVVGTVLQYGNVVGISDMMSITGIDNLMMETTDMLGQNGGETIEGVVRNVLAAGTSVRYANGTARSSVGAGNIFTLSLLRAAIAQLKASNARKYSGPDQMERPDGQGTYRLYLHPYQMMDFIGDTQVSNALQNNPNNNAMWTGALGRILDVDIYESTLNPIFAGQGASGANVYGALLIGQDAFGVVDVAGRGKYSMEIRDFQSGGTSDPLGQRATIGWKAFQLPVILNNNFMVRIETGATGG